MRDRIRWEVVLMFEWVIDPGEVEKEEWMRCGGCSGDADR